MAAPAAAAAATVRIVPSTGRTTARRASSEAWPMASTRTSGPTPASPAAAMRSLIPRRSCERITPEFPRAPISEPWPMALHTAARPAPASTPSSSLTTASRVSAMLVPVSPSGTG